MTTERNSAHTAQTLVRDLQALRSCGCRFVRVMVAGREYRVAGVDRSTVNQETIDLYLLPARD